MLRSLEIHDVLIIDRLDLQFQPGLNVLTGETGAGKSILLDALGFALGRKVRRSLIRAGATQGSVTAAFDLADRIDAALAQHRQVGPLHGEGHGLVRQLRRHVAGGAVGAQDAGLLDCRCVAWPGCLVAVACPRAGLSGRWFYGTLLFCFQTVFMVGARVFCPGNFDRCLFCICGAFDGLIAIKTVRRSTSACQIRATQIADLVRNNLVEVPK